MGLTEKDLVCFELPMLGIQIGRVEWIQGGKVRVLLDCGDSKEVPLTVLSRVCSFSGLVEPVIVDKEVVAQGYYVKKLACS